MMPLVPFYMAVMAAWSLSDHGYADPALHFTLGALGAAASVVIAGMKEFR